MRGPIEETQGGLEKQWLKWQRKDFSGRDGGHLRIVIGFHVMSCLNNASSR